MERQHQDGVGHCWIERSHMNTVTQLTAENERELRRWLMRFDSQFAMHRQLKDYFLAPTPNFGTLCIRNGDNSIRSVCFFSSYDGKAFIHQYIGEVSDLEDFRQYMKFPCQAFLRPEHTPSADTGWKNVLDVTPGFVVDHPAYNGVFSRVAPRFSGAVYEHP